MAILDRVTGWVWAGILLSALPSMAQWKVGDFSNSLSGNLSLGYTTDWGNQINSDHNLTLGGNASLSGSFYSPNFLSYSLNGYLNQSRANSNFQSISDASGLDASASIFGGSHFPGSVSYSRAWNSEGNYDVPGLANYVTHGNNQSLGVNWSENLPEWPSFAAGYLLGDSNYTVYGTSDEGTNKYHTLNFRSTYSVAGFHMGGYYTKGDNQSQTPEFVAGQSEQVHTGTSGYGATVSRQIPWHGSTSASFNSSSWNMNFLGTQTSGTVDLFNANASVHPTEKLSVSASSNYSDNLSGQLIEQVIAAGGTAAGLSSQSSDSLDLLGVVTYSYSPSLQTSAFAERHTESFEGQDYEEESYGGTASYSRELLDGMFHATVSAQDNNIPKTGQNILGFSTNENYSSLLFGWHVEGAFNYSQNMQTLAHHLHELDLWLQC